MSSEHSETHLAHCPLQDLITLTCTISQRPAPDGDTGWLLPKGKSTPGKPLADLDDPLHSTLGN